MLHDYGSILIPTNLYTGRYYNFHYSFNIHSQKDRNSIQLTSLIIDAK